MISRYRAAAVQFEPALGRKAENVVKLLELSEAAARDGARLIVLPELATTGYCWYDRDEVGPLVEPIPGPTTERFAALAARYDCYIVVGLPEVNPDTGIYYNSAALVGPGGLIGVYRKTHSFVSEPKWAKDGDRDLPVWETPLGRLGILICADAEYLEPARLLALRGADVLCFPTNWLGDRCPAPPWLARAMENGCYLVAANRYGLERTIQFAGGSCILDPDGATLARAGSGDAVVSAEIDLERARAKSFYPGGPPEKLQGRRPELYANLTLNAYLFNPLWFHGLYEHRPLPAGARSRVAAVQFQPEPGAVAANLRQMARLLSECGEDIALAVFPEYAVTGAPRDASEARSLAHAGRPAWLSELTELARSSDTVIVAGFVEELDGALYSTALVVGPEGELARYRKAHPIGHERDWCRPGVQRPPVLDLPLGRLGVLLGSDLWFPEASVSLALEGCDLLAVPGGPNLPPIIGLRVDGHGEDGSEEPTHFHIGRLRAQENSCYLALASLPAPHGLGYSAVFPPSRQEDDEPESLLDPEATGIVTGLVDTTNLDTRFPTSAVRAKEHLRRRQPAIYDLLQVAEPPALDLIAERSRGG